MATRSVLIGEVLGIRTGQVRTPALIYFERLYHAVEGPAPSL